ncbi:MAG: LOG family protein, partial [Candidatus Eremiobacteraeota bacterium]|nr:LOG family protein [Candidatus Eremiobacteraeota bacterium]
GGMSGVMEAAARGCAEAGGLVVGIVPTAEAQDANDHVSVPIVTGMGEGRNIIIVRSAQAVIAVGGSYGTLSEIALALRLEIPVIGLHTWVFSRERPDEPDPIVRVTTAAAAVDVAWKAIND